MRNRRQLTNLVVLAGILALVGCASARVEYANSHGYYPARINGKKYYCTPKPLIWGRDLSATASCLTLADIERVRTGKQPPPSPTPGTALVPHGFRRVMINDQQMFCWSNYTTETVMWSRCDPSLAVAQAHAQAARVQAWYQSQRSGIWGDSSYSAFGSSSPGSNGAQSYTQGPLIVY